MGKFVQLVEFRAAPENVARLKAAARTLMTAENEKLISHSMLARDRDEPGWFAVIVEFASFEDAQRNNALSSTQELARRVADMAIEGPTYCNLDVITEFED